MAATKRPLDDVSSGRKHKKTKTSEKSRTKKAEVEKPSTLVTEEIDFPRGGGTSFTPLEVKTIRTEAAKEADEALFKVRDPNSRSPYLNPKCLPPGSTGGEKQKEAEVKKI